MVAPTFPPVGQVLSVAGTNIANAYNGPGTSSAINLGRAKRVRFFVHVVTAVGSNLTTITVKLQQRYNDGTNTLGFMDLPSNLNDVQGAAQPKGQTLEIEHAYTVAANQTNDFGFYVDEIEGSADLQVMVHANAAGITGDAITIYGIASGHKAP